MAGILPIIKYNTHSAIPDFKKRTILKHLMLAKYVGFTQEDVHAVCQKYEADKSLMKAWCDGYNLPGVGKVYCPSSVIDAARNDDYSNHWTATASMEALNGYIYADLDGLVETL